ncbi:hypothetical protein R4769_21495, partial [Azotobacter beijerinckii]|nr:hypothetical protein [Azotobacter beijerinckii]
AAPAGQFARVAAVIEERCTVCHSARPTSPLFASAPAGVMLDSPAQIRALAPKIHAQAVASQLMPLGNLTGMTPEERELIGAWIAAGARID